jgi:hypothetical protein
MGTKNSKQDGDAIKQIALKQKDTQKPLIAATAKLPSQQTEPQTTPDNNNRLLALPDYQHVNYPQRFARRDHLDYPYGYSAYPTHLQLSSSSNARFLSQARIPGDFVDYQPYHLKNINDIHGIENFRLDRRKSAYRTYRPGMGNNDSDLKNNQFDTGVGDSKPTKSTLLLELLECPICMNRYEDPHVLPCQHTFCSSCLKVLKTTSSHPDPNVLQCPICREIHTLKNGLDDIPPNYTMKRLIELEAMQAEKEAVKPSSPLVNMNKHDFKYKTLQRSRQRYEEPSPPPVTRGKRYYHHERSHRDDKFEFGLSKNSKFKIILLCHSAALESYSESSTDEDYQEKFKDEYGQCTTFTKISVYGTDHLESIKKLVEKKFGIPYKEQLLVHHDKVMRSDYKQLFQYSIKSLSRIHVFDKRDVKDNIHEIEDEEPYYVDTDFLKELANCCEKKDSMRFQGDKENFKKAHKSAFSNQQRRVRKINE